MLFLKIRNSFCRSSCYFATPDFFGNLPVPLNLRNAPTKLMKDMGYGEGYEMYTDEDLFPEKLKGKRYFQ